MIFVVEKTAVNRSWLELMKWKIQKVIFKTITKVIIKTTTITMMLITMDIETETIYLHQQETKMFHMNVQGSLHI